jgi:uncharacterized RDD family membrane protein YckC
MSTSVSYAPLWRRLAACLYDVFPVLALWMATGAIAIGVSGGAMDVRHPPLAYRLALLGVTLAYFVLSWVFGGQTLGARAWRVRVAAADGNPPRLPAALLRGAVALVSIAALGLGFVWALIDARHRTWHDLAAGTALVRCL